MAGRDERVCVRTMTDVPKVNVRKVPSNGEEDDVRPKKKKKDSCRSDGKTVSYLERIT